MGVSVGPAFFAEGFVSAGLHMVQGHEALIHEAWFVEKYWNELPPGNKPYKYNSSSTAIILDGADNMVVDTIIWQYTHLGVAVNGGANVLIGVHSWGCGQPWCDYLTAVAISTPSVRIIGCYMDWSSLVISNPNSVTVTSSFFLGAKLAVEGGASTVMKGLDFIDNTFAPGGITISPNIRQCSNVRMEGNIGPGGSAIPGVSYRLAIPWVHRAADGVLTIDTDFTPYVLLPWSMQGFSSHSVVGGGHLSLGSTAPEVSTFSVNSTAVRNVLQNFPAGKDMDGTLFLQVWCCDGGL